MFLTTQLQLLLAISTLISSYRAKSACPDIQKLTVLPGFGWDPLTNKDKIQLMKLSYDECKLTSDGRYLIPDNTEAETFQPEERQVVHDMFSHWLNYNPPTGPKSEDESLNPLYSFSNECREVKNLQIKHKAFLSRIQLRQRYYRVYLRNATVTDAVGKRFADVIDAVNQNQTEEAKRLIREIVRDYGPEYVTFVDVGTIYAKEDYLRRDFVNKYLNEKDNIISASKIALRECTGFTWKENEELNSSLVEEYNTAVLEKKTRVYGQPNWNNETRPAMMVSIYRTSKILPSGEFEKIFLDEIPNSLLREVKNMITNEIVAYYNKNKHSGCTDPNAENFDYAANQDDGSCVTSTFVFGGVFQNCQQQNQAFVYKACDELGRIIKNPLTTATTCPIGFVRSQIFNYFSSYSYSNSLKFRCSKLGYKDNIELSYLDYLNLTTYSCISNSTESMQSSYKFGGVYSADVVNIHTKNASCPPLYESLNIFEGQLSVCVSRINSVRTRLYELPFGGFTSYWQEFLCPKGYSTHLAVKYHDINVYYCLRERNPINFGIEYEIKEL